MSHKLARLLHVFLGELVDVVLCVLCGLRQFARLLVNLVEGFVLFGEVSQHIFVGFAIEL